MPSPHWNPWHHDHIERRFVDVKEGQIHLRVTREAPTANNPPLVLLHASPASGMPLVPLMTALSSERRCFAPDTLGFGDSAPPVQQDPTAADYAKSIEHLCEALGLEQIDLYGSHTGAHIATELALAQPQLVRKLILDGIALFSAEEKQEMLDNYAPHVEPDIMGGQFNWAWHFVRDQFVYFPYFKRDAEHLRQMPMGDPKILHAIVVDTLKGLTTFHLGYRSAFSHPDRERLVKLTQPTLVTSDDSDPLKVTMDEAHSLVPDSVKLLGPSLEDEDYLGKKARGINQFLDD